MFMQMVLGVKSFPVLSMLQVFDGTAIMQHNYIKRDLNGRGEREMDGSQSMTPMHQEIWVPTLSVGLSLRMVFGDEDGNPHPQGSSPLKQAPLSPRGGCCEQ